MTKKELLELAARIGLKLPHSTNTDNPIDFPIAMSEKIVPWYQRVESDHGDRAEWVLHQELHATVAEIEQLRVALMDAEHNLSVLVKHYEELKHDSRPKYRWETPESFTSEADVKFANNDFILGWHTARALKDEGVK